MTSTRKERLERFGSAPAPGPRPKYDYVKTVGRTAVTAGILSAATGPVTDPRSGALAAGQAMTTLLWRLLEHLEARGGLEAVEQIVRLEGFVHASPTFVGHSGVLDGASEVLFNVFRDTPDQGRHTRLAVGSPSLPNGGDGPSRAVELSLWVELKA